MQGSESVQVSNSRGKIEWRSVATRLAFAILVFAAWGCASCPPGQAHRMLFGECEKHNCPNGTDVMYSKCKTKDTGAGPGAIEVCGCSGGWRWNGSECVSACAQGTYFQSRDEKTANGVNYIPGCFNGSNMDTWSALPSCHNELDNVEPWPSKSN